MSASLVAELRANISEFSAKMGAARADLAKLNTEGSGHMAKLHAVSKAAFEGVAGAAVATAVVSVKAAANYQEALTHLVTGAGESEKNIKLVGDGMLHMAGQVGIGALDLSKGMFMIESAGFHGADGLKVLRAAAEGAKVGNADMAVVSDALTTVLKDYHLPASQAADVTSKLVETVASGKTHMQDLAGSMATVLPAASAAHVGLSQVLGAMATMTAEGTPAADAATYLKQTILKLEAPSAASAHEMQSLGINVFDLKDKLGERGLTGTFKIMTDAIKTHMGPAGAVLIENLKKAGSNTTAFQKILANLPPAQQTVVEALSRMVGGSKNLQAALELTGGNAKDFADNVKKVGDTTVETGGHVVGFGLTQKDLNSKLADAKAAWQSLEIEIGQKIIPVLSSAADWIGKHKKLVEDVAIALGALTVGLAAYYAVSKTVEAATKARTAAQWLLNVALDANPIGLIIVAVAALAAGFVYAYEHSETFRRIVKEGMHDIQRIVGETVKFVIEMFKTWFDSVMLGYGILVHGAAKAFGWIPGLGGKLKEAAKGFDEFKSAVDDKLQQVADAAGNWGREAGARVAEGMTQAFNANFGGFQAAGLSAVAAASAAGAQAKLSQYADGGVIGGRRGEAQLVIAHGGEVVLNQNQQEGFRNVMGSYGTAASQPAAPSSAGVGLQPIVVQLVLDGRVLAENTLTVLQRLSHNGTVLGLP